tara:strand:+ start:7808 stop:8416 length:609 start_codon:yes stop_codon:yes gene_type:complete
MPVIKVIILGDTNVGKTAFIGKYLKRDVSVKHKPTIGHAMSTKQIDFNNASLDLHIWDTAGQERYSSLTALYYRSSNIAIIMYDITNPQSFIRAKDYMNDIKIKAPSNVAIGLIGNKSDIVIENPSNRAIPYSVGKEIADIHDAFFAETNVFNNNDAKCVFGSLIDMVPSDVIYSYKGEPDSLLDHIVDNNQHLEKDCCNIL